MCSPTFETAGEWRPRQYLQRTCARFERNCRLAMNNRQIKLSNLLAMIDDRYLRNFPDITVLELVVLPGGPTWRRSSIVG
jgi:hypothetical protein